MRKFVIFCFLLAASTAALAQSPIGKGGKQINFGLGINSGGIPVYFGMDFGVHPDITVGGQISLDLEGDYFSISGRGDYHFNTILNIPRDWDFYAGLSLGVAAGINDRFDTGLDLGLQVGGRYYWNSNWGVNLEIGGGSALSGGRFGLSHRF